MEFTNEFRVSLPLDPAWDLLNDVERIAPCMPGAQLTGSDGDQYQGTVKVRLGPVAVQYKGTATVESRDRANRTLAIRAAGRDSRGQGNADALVTALLAPDGDGTRVTVTTKLSVTGKVAQFGKGVMEDVSRKLLTQFTESLETMLAEEKQLEPALPSGAAVQASPNPVSDATAAPAPTATSANTATAAPSPTEPEAIDLLSVARGAVLKRVAPAAVGVLIVIGVVIWLIH